LTWLDTLLSRGSEAKRAVTDVTHVTRPQPDRGEIHREEPVEIRHVTIQTSAPRDGHPGSIVVGYYSVSDGVVTMHDEDGKATGQRDRVGPNEDPRQVAYRLRRATWRNSLGECNFNRPLHYPPLSIA